MKVGSLRFTVLGTNVSPPSVGKLEAYLVGDDWDDWFSFATLYHLHVFDGDGTRHSIGRVKIGQIDMEDRQRKPHLPFYNSDWHCCRPYR